MAEPLVTWASADAAIATVDAAGGVVGRVTALRFGTTKVTATYNSATAEAAVEVALQGKVSGLRLWDDTTWWARFRPN